LNSEQKEKSKKTPLKEMDGYVLLRGVGLLEKTRPFLQGVSYAMSAAHWIESEFVNV
jgi:hypothetical protein